MDTPRLHPDTIEEVKQRIDIVDLISERVVLKKRGREYVGLCPFHEEKSPSFTVSPAKQMYYCFGCGAGGNGIKFFMEVGNNLLVKWFSILLEGIKSRLKLWQ